MRRLEKTARAFLVASLMTGTGCRMPDLGGAYVAWATNVGARVVCDKRNQPRLVINLETNPSIADHFVLKITSNTGNTAEQDIFPDPQMPNRLSAVAEFSRYQHSSKGQRVDDPLKTGDVVSVAAYGITEKSATDSTRLVSVVRLEQPTSAEITCSPPDRILRLGLT